MLNTDIVYGLVRNGETLTTADGVVCFATVEAAEQAKQALNLEESKGISTEAQAFRLSRTVVAGE